MPRYRRTRRYRRKSGRWSSNITTITKESIAAASGSWYGTLVLATNPVQVNTGVSQTFTAKNFEISFTLEGTPSASLWSLDAISAYIMYVPQGMTVTDAYESQHPEYILNYKYYGSPTSAYVQSVGNPENYMLQHFQPMKIKSRLSRKLQTGDSIVLLIKGSNASSSTTNLILSGIVRWWTKAN